MIGGGGDRVGGGTGSAAGVEESWELEAPRGYVEMTEMSLRELRQ